VVGASRKIILLPILWFFAPTLSVYSPDSPHRIVPRKLTLPGLGGELPWADWSFPPVNAIQPFLSGGPSSGTPFSSSFYGLSKFVFIVLRLCKFSELAKGNPLGSHGFLGSIILPWSGVKVRGWSCRRISSTSVLFPLRSRCPPNRFGRVFPRPPVSDRHIFPALFRRLTHFPQPLIRRTSLFPSFLEGLSTHLWHDSLLRFTNRFLFLLNGGQKYSAITPCSGLILVSAYRP